MYRCSICKRVSEPGQPRLTHIIQRQVPSSNVRVGPSGDNESTNATRSEIAKELPVCQDCYRSLTTGGVSLNTLRVAKQSLSSGILRPAVKF